jgi:hypothetical protein
VIDFEVDDQAPDELAVALDRLRAADGVLDVVQWPVSGKKGRAGARVQVLARPELRDDVIERCFVETTTIGLRWRLSARAVLERETVTIDGARGPVRVKLARRPGGGETAKADIAPEADGQTARRRARQEAEAAALRRRDDGGGENEPG